MAAPEEDPFAEFLEQEQAAGAHHAAYAEQAAAPAQDPNIALRQLVECAQRQEQLLGKVCSLLVGLDEKMGRIADSQERLESALPNKEPGASVAAPRTSGSASTRGALVPPPGKIGTPAPAQPGIAAAGASFNAPQRASAGAEEQRLAAEKLALDRARIEEEGRRREAELARKREEDERRKQEEAERKRLEEERRREAERQRKAALEEKTGSFMNDLIAGSGSSGLFGDDEPKRGKKGGLFDD
mmetsp:Transcript_5223/g.15388  ORF Transcript_5223/g.15388 Transcript_5223/m.15388 type:complete len:243 (+) Transcript_5223:66-794(+)